MECFDCVLCQTEKRCSSEEPMECEAQCAGTDAVCDDLMSNEILATCDLYGETYYADTCTDCEIGENTTLCRSSDYGATCTADSECNGKQLGQACAAGKACSGQCTCIETAGTVRTYVYGTEYKQGGNGTIYTQILNSTGYPANSANCNASIYRWATPIVSYAEMTYISGSHGAYFYNFTVPTQPNVYMVVVNCTNPDSYGSAEFHVSEWQADIITGLSNQATLQSALNVINASTWNLANISATDVWAAGTRTLTDYNQTLMEAYFNAINTSTWNLANLTDVEVWAAGARTLTDYNQTAMLTYLTGINTSTWNLENITVNDIWSAGSRTLTAINWNIFSNWGLQQEHTWNATDRNLTAVDWNTYGNWSTCQEYIWNATIDDDTANATLDEINETTWWIERTCE
ncbi:MAG: hypothetical protein KAV87_08075 [Desulfobacteraceae bacterium]|nr:hypothetical protein [Desulfobacteraceae bacterium]